MEKTKQNTVGLKLEYMQVSKFLNCSLPWQKQWKEMPPPRKPTLLTPFPKAHCILQCGCTTQVTHGLDSTTLAEHLEVSRWKVLEKYTTSIHSFDTRYHLCWAFPYRKFWNTTQHVHCYLEVHPHENMQLHSKLWGSNIKIESMHIALKEDDICNLLALFSRCNFKKWR